MLSWITGGGSTTWKVTVTLWGLLPATGDVTSTRARWVPEDTPTTDAESVRVLGAWVELKLVTSQPAAPST